MKTQLTAAGLLAATALAWAASDPVIMTVNGVDVPKSEFEYLYHKNSQQQLDPRPLEEYVEMFKIYKLKVADARANGIDTTAAFRSEMAQYASELAAPYLSDSTYINKLVDVTLDRMKTEAEARHVMLYKGDGVSTRRANRALADSIRGVLLSGGDLAALAAEFSVDRNSATEGGSMGFITAGKFPYNFETAVFETAEGVVAPLVESPYGYHVVVGGKKRPANGSVLTRHILVMAPKGVPEQVDASAKAKADSIHQLLVADPERFAELAQQFSDDRRSGQEGGMLPWFQAGEMIPLFSDAAFALADGQLSEPIRTQVGYHIIQRLQSRPVEDAAALRPGIVSRITNPQDERYQMVVDDRTARFAKKFKASLNKPVVAAMRADACELGLDSAFFAKYGSAPESRAVLLTIGKRPVTVGEFIADAKGKTFTKFTEPEVQLDREINGYFSRLLNAEAEARLEKEQPDYRNLLNEYREGSLLYEISLQRVWDKASRDREGLEQFYAAHRDDYRWQEPHVKGYLVQAAGDSIAEQMRERLQTAPKDSVVRTFRKAFGAKQGQIERVLATKGQNPMIDNLMFGGEPVQPQNSAYTTYFLFDARLLDEPDELNDVRSLVTNDYQTWLEQQWINELKEKYPVSVNEKVLRKVK